MEFSTTLQSHMFCGREFAVAVIPGVILMLQATIRQEFVEFPGLRSFPLEAAQFPWGCAVSLAPEV